MPTGTIDELDIERQGYFREIIEIILTIYFRTHGRYNRRSEYFTSIR